MKIEKINENKIRITLSGHELEERHLDFQALRHNTPEVQTLFWDMMKQAETEHGFKTANCQLFIEAASVMGGQFVVTITRLHDKVAPPEPKKKSSRPELKVKKKSTVPEANFICKFNTFEQLCTLIDSNTVSPELPSTLFEYKGAYFLLVKLEKVSKFDSNKVKLAISEFGEIVNDYSYVSSVLQEHGNKVISKNALNKINEVFVKNN